MGEITHAHVSAIPDDPDADVGSDEWNAAHNLDNSEILDFKTAETDTTKRLRPDGAGGVEFATAAAVAAADVSVADAGGLTAETTVEGALADVFKTTRGYKPHGSTGAAETFDASVAGWHSATLDANCTITLTGATSGLAAELLLELLQDGTGGWTITLPAAVTNKADIEAAQNTTADSTSFLLLISRDGGTTWYGFWTANSTPSGHSYVGYNAIGGTNASMAQYQHFAKSVVLASAGFLASVGAYVKGQSAGVVNALSVGVWDNVSSSPAHLLAGNSLGRGGGGYFPETVNGAAPDAGWIQIPLGIYLPAGTYWIGYMQSASATYNNYYDGSGSDVTWTAASDNLSGGTTRYTKTVTSNKYSIRASILR